MISDVLDAARELAQSLEDSTVLIRRKTGQVLDQSTGLYVPTWAAIYEGPARIRFSQADPREVDGVGQRVAEQSPTVGLPIAADPRIVSGSSAAVRKDDQGIVTANPDDPGIVGTEFRVTGQHSQTHSSARRLPVEVVSHGG